MIPVPIRENSISKLSEMFLNATLSPLLVRTYNISVTNNHTVSTNISIKMYVPLCGNATGNYTIKDSKSVASIIENIRQVILLNKITEIAVMKVNQIVINSYNVTTIYYLNITNTNCSNNGNSGTKFTETETSINFSVKKTNGAENTKTALFLSNDESETKSSIIDGPILSFPASNPGRISYYTRLQYYPYSSANFGGLFTLLSRNSVISNDNVSCSKNVFHDNGDNNNRNNSSDNGDKNSTDYNHNNTNKDDSLSSTKINDTNNNSAYSRSDTDDMPTDQIIGVYIGSNGIIYDTNFKASFNFDKYNQNNNTIDHYPLFDIWYKVDIHLNWLTGLYYIMLNDLIVADDIPFRASHVDGFKLSLTRGVRRRITAIFSSIIYYHLLFFVLVLFLVFVLLLQISYSFID